VKIGFLTGEEGMTRMILAIGLTLASAAWAEEVQLVPLVTEPVASADGLSNGPPRRWNNGKILVAAAVETVSFDGLSNGPPRRWINAVSLTTGTSAVDAGSRLSGGPQRRWNNGAPVTAAPSP
jgi:hypothetical protein